MKKSISVLILCIVFTSCYVKNNNTIGRKYIYQISGRECISSGYVASSLKGLQQIDIFCENDECIYPSGTSLNNLDFYPVSIKSKVELIKYSKDSTYAEAWVHWYNREKDTYGVGRRNLIPIKYLNDRSYEYLKLEICADSNY